MVFISKMCSAFLISRLTSSGDVTFWAAIADRSSFRHVLTASISPCLLAVCNCFNDISNINPSGINIRKVMLLVVITGIQLRILKKPVILAASREPVCSCNCRPGMPWMEMVCNQADHLIQFANKHAIS